MIILLARRPVFFLEADGAAAGSGGVPPAPPTQPGPPPPPENAPPAGEGEIGEEWKGWWAAQLQKETREKHKDSLLALKGKTIGDVFDDYFDGKARLQNAVVFPGKDAPPEEIEAFLKRMDIPKTADEYGLDPKAILSPDTDEVKAEAAKGLAGFFKSIGLTRNQAKNVYEQYAGIVKGISEAGAARQKALADTFEERMLKEAGGDEKAATETKEYYKRALIALGDKQLVQELSQSGMMYSTAFARGLADIWKAGNQEPPIVQGSGGNGETKDALPKGDEFNKRYGSRR
jgi:hypothetical protein